MSDQTPDPHDDVLRAALEAEADEVVAGPELLDRIRASAAAPPRRPLAPWLLVAAAAVAVAGLTAVLLRDDDQAVDISNDPASTSSSSTTDTIEPAPDLTGLLPVEFACEQGEVLDLTIYLRADASDGDVEAMRVALAADPRITSARHLDGDEVFDVLAAGGTFDPALGVRVPSAFLVDLAEGVDETEVRGDVADRAGVYGLYDAGCLADPARPERPTTIALVREDGWLVTVDLTTGAQRELHFGGDPNASSDVEEGGPSFIDGVDLSPDGAWVYFSTCCEPANGITYRVPTGGGEVEPVAMGRSPRVSPDGSVVATSAGTAIVVSPTQGASGTPVTVETGGFARQLAWSPAGTQLAAISGSGAEGEVPQVLLFGWDGTTLTPQDPGKPDNPGSFVSWTPDGTLTVSSGGPVDDDRSLAQDDSYGWLLWVDEGGVVREQAGHESSDRAPIEGLPEALTADW